MSSKDNGEERVMHSKSNNIEIIMIKQMKRTFSITSFQVSNWVGNINERQGFQI